MFVKVIATDSNADTAAMIANSVANQYVAMSQAARRKSIAAAAKAIELRMRQLSSRVVALRLKLAGTGKSSALRAELQVAEEAYSSLGSRLEQLKVSEQLETGAGTVVAEAVPDRKQVSPKPLRNAALALAIGLALGLAVAFALEYFEDSKTGN